MTIKRLFLALIAFSLLLPLSGCGCRRDSCCDNRSFSPPPRPCCPTPGPAGFVPGPNP